MVEEEQLNRNSDWSVASSSSTEQRSLESRHPAARRPSGAAREPTRTTRRQHAAQHVTTLHCSHTLLKELIFFLNTKYFWTIFFKNKIFVSSNL